jgi:hypothetical protein
MKLKIESGRSMIEILGVLAIIGILSIASIMGYSYGIDKYHANETINDVNMRMIDIAMQAYHDQSEITMPQGWDTRGRAGYIIDVFQNIDSEPSIIVEQVPSRICKMILKNTPDTQDIFVGVKNDEQVDGYWYLGDNEDICGNNDKKEMLFSLSPEILASFNPDNGTHTELEGTETIPITAQKQCYSNADCDTANPYCNTLGECVKCSADTPIWNGNTCEACPSETPFWNDTHKMCVECLDSTSCHGDTPYCNTDMGKCVACLANTHCEGKEIPLCDTTRGICDCPDTSPYYNADLKYCGNCQNHSDCSHLGENYLCLNINRNLKDSTLCSKNPGYNICSSYTILKTAIIDDKEWIYVGIRSHWDAEKICKALGKDLPTVQELVTESNGSAWNGSVAVQRTRTELAKKLQSTFNIEWIWTPSLYPWTSCGAVYVSIVSGWVGGNSTFDRAYGGWTLCR